jgi:hypothetical protein
MPQAAITFVSGAHTKAKAPIRQQAFQQYEKHWRGTRAAREQNARTIVLGVAKQAERRASLNRAIERARRLKAAAAQKAAWQIRYNERVKKVAALRKKAQADRERKFRIQEPYWKSLGLGYKPYNPETHTKHGYFASEQYRAALKQAIRKNNPNNIHLMSPKDRHAYLTRIREEYFAEHPRWRTGLSRDIPEHLEDAGDRLKWFTREWAKENVKPYTKWGMYYNEPEDPWDYRHLIKNPENRRHWLVKY